MAAGSPVADRPGPGYDELVANHDLPRAGADHGLMLDLGPAPFGLSQSVAWLDLAARHPFTAEE